MQEVTKTGVLIDLCPQCKSVCLDRGEVEKVLSRAREIEREWEEERERFKQRPRGYDDDAYYYKRRYGSAGRERKNRWTEIFDSFN